MLRFFMILLLGGFLYSGCGSDIHSPRSDNANQAEMVVTKKNTQKAVYKILDEATEEEYEEETPEDMAID